jgi:hypothetical protein
MPLGMDQGTLQPVRKERPIGKIGQAVAESIVFMSAAFSEMS